MYEITEEPFSDAPHRLRFGSGRICGITRDGVPYLTVETEETFHQMHLPCCFFRQWLCIGDNKYVRLIDLETLEYQEISLKEIKSGGLGIGYFGYFEPLPDMLLFSTASAVFALDSSGKLLWQTDDLAVDGILFQGVTADGRIEIACCMDPPEPEGWCDRLLDLKTGKECTH